MKLQGYNGPRVTAEELGKVCDEDQRGTVQVLDIGAGTGLVAEEVQYMYWFEVNLNQKQKTKSNRDRIESS